MEMYRKCVQCGRRFTVTDKERAFFESKGYKLPKRCKACRKENRDEAGFIEEEYLHMIVDGVIEERRLHAQFVKHKHFDKPLDHDVRNLFIVGNGFDIWQDLKTSYYDFADFYERHKIDFSWELGIEPVETLDNNGKHIETSTQFDLLYFYLSEFYPTERDPDSDFWSDFENSLAELDDVRINQYFGKEIDDLRDIRLDCDYAHALIRKCFYEWAKSIDIPEIDSSGKYAFDESLFINFNYTDTLTVRFGIDRNDIIHIHGTANDPDSIVFGHGKPIDADPIAMQMGGRFAGGYIILTVLDKFYKRSEVQWRILMQRLKNKAVELAAVENVYVLGHSLGKADEYYFKQLCKLVPSSARWHISCYSDNDLKRAENMTDKLKISNKEFYRAIDEALKQIAK